MDDRGYSEDDFPLTLSAEAVDDILNYFCNVDIYIEELRWAAWQSDESYLYITYFNKDIKHTILFEDAEYEYDFDSQDEIVDWIVGLEEKIENEKLTKLKEPAATIAHAICEYIDESWKLPYEPDLEVLIKDYLYND